MTNSTNFKNTEKMKTLSRFKNAASIKTAQQKGFFNMKSLSLNKVTLIALKLKPLVLILFSLVPLMATSQEIKWAKSYNGGTSMSSSTANNSIMSSVYDSKGNLYISGRAGGGGAVMDDSDIFGIPSNKSGVFIAKIDSEGTVIWKKSIVSQLNETSSIQIQLLNDSSLMVFTEIHPPYLNKEDRMYFLDTIIRGNYTECTFPFPKKKCGHDALLELDTEDGHLITANYFRTLYHGSEDFNSILQALDFCFIPFFVDKNRNLYLFINLTTGFEGTHSFDLIINDQDTLSFDDDTCFTHKFLKLSPDLELV